MSEIPPLTVFPSVIWADRDLLESDLRVLGVLCAHYNHKTGQCNPSQTRIADEAGYSRATVQSALVRLRKWGYIDWETPRRKDGGNGVSFYRIPMFESRYGQQPSPDLSGPWQVQGGQGLASDDGLPPTTSGLATPDKPRVVTNIEAEQRKGTKNVNTAARSQARGVRKIHKGKNPSDDVEVDDAP